MINFNFPVGDEIKIISLYTTSRFGYEVCCERTKLRDFLAFFCCGTWQKNFRSDEEERPGYYIFPTRETGYHFLWLIGETGYHWQDDIDRFSRFPASARFLDEMHGKKEEDGNDGWVKVINEYCPNCGYQTLQEYHNERNYVWLQCSTCGYCEDDIDD